MRKIFIFAAIFIFVVSSVFILGNIKKSPDSHLTAAISQQFLDYFREQIALLLKKIQEIQQQLNELIAKQKEEAATTTSAVTATTTTIAVPALPSPFESTLKITVISSSYTLSTYGEKVLTEFKLTADEKIAINRIRFENGALYPISDIYLVNLKLMNSSTNEVLATVDTPTDKIIEFKMTADDNKSDRGLMISGKTYHVLATIKVPSYGDIKPRIRLDIESASDIDAFDYNDLTRVADISKSVSFPVLGPTITAF